MLKYTQILLLNECNTCVIKGKAIIHLLQIIFQYIKVGAQIRFNNCVIAAVTIRYHCNYVSASFSRTITVRSLFEITIQYILQRNSQLRKSELYHISNICNKINNVAGKFANPPLFRCHIMETLAKYIYH